jgi:3',5'-cyclic-AMP phosphodiesterase
MRVAVAVLAVAACTRPGEDRALAELLVGTATLGDVSVEVAGGLAAVRDLGDHRLELWCGAPVLDLHVELGPGDGGPWTLVLRNSLPDAVVTVAGTSYARVSGEHPTTGTFVVPLVAGASDVHVGPPDADLAGPFRVVAMADIQSAMPQVHEVFAQINTVPDARFVVAMGDITDRAELAEYELFDLQYQTLRIPFYTTLGNHELWADPQRYFDRFGRASFHYVFKQVAFTYADSGDAGIDPLVESWLDEYFAAAHDRTHVFLTHMPPIDPVGIRYGGFRSAQDGRRLISRLVEADVDLALYGHIHTLVEYEDAGIPSYISGGGGAEPMRWDGIDRHFLIIDLDAETGVRSVAVHRVD